MAGTTGNTNASKWTRELTHKTLDQIEALAHEEHIFTLSQALMQLKHYKQLWSYFKKIWELDGDIMDRIYYIEQVFICKIEDAALFKKLNPTACFFILRQNYGYNTKEKDELPSHLIADLEQQQSDTPPSSTKTKAPPQEKPTLSVIQPPATGLTSIHKDMYNTAQRQSDKLISVNPHNHRPHKAQPR